MPSRPDPALWAMAGAVFEQQLVLSPLADFFPKTGSLVEDLHRVIREAGQSYHEMLIDQRWPVSNEVRQAGCRR